MSIAFTATPLRYTEALEALEEDESESIASLKASLSKIASTTYRNRGHASRAVHAKAHALLKGQMEVAADLPEALAQGLFAEPGPYPVVLRFSTSPGDILDDKVSTPRGLAMKIFRVHGDRLPGSEYQSTQDFLMVDGPAFITPDAKAFSRSLKLLAATTNKAEGAKKVLSAALRGLETVIESVGGESAGIKGLGGHPLTHPLGETYFTQVPFRHGAHVAKYSLVPVSPNLQALKDAPVDLKGEPNGLRKALAEFFSTQEAEWALRAQLCTDVRAMPIEDASVVWPEAQSPYVTVARIRVPQHAPIGEADLQVADDALFFNPWTGLAAHRPLGSINRARRHAYEESARFRATRNGVKDGEASLGGACPVTHA